MESFEEDSCYKSVINFNTNNNHCYIKCSGYTACVYTIINCYNHGYKCIMLIVLSQILMINYDIGICADITIS